MAIKFRIGQGIKTRSGKIITIQKIEWVAGAGSRRKRIITIKWEDGTENRVTKRALTKMTTDASQDTPDDDDDDNDDVSTPAPSVPTNPGLSSDLAQAIAQAVAPHVKSNISREEVERIVDERVVDVVMPRRVECVSPVTGEVRDVGVQHVYFEAIRRIAMNRMNLWLTGPAGSGKTSVAAAVAESLDLPHYALSVCSLTSKADLIGYKNVSDGAYVKTDLRQAYEEGGVFLLDEVDAGNPNVMVIANAMLANDQCAFPDGMVKKHKDFILLAGANTIGLGADKQYLGRNALDKATIDRFVMMEFPYDPAVMAVMCGVAPSCFGELRRPKPIEFIQTEDKADADNDARLKSATNQRCDTFCRTVAKVMGVVDELKVRHLVGPRAASSGCKLIRLGFTTDDAMNMAVWKGLDADTVSKVMARV